MPQPVEVDGILVAARDRRGARHHHLEHVVTDAARIATIRHRIGKPPAHAQLALCLAKSLAAVELKLMAEIPAKPKSPPGAVSLNHRTI
jgi:hypothetical protein